MTPVVRELRVTDIRCGFEPCGAAPGEPCRTYGAMSHLIRIEEAEALIAAGWQWQEVDPRDVGAK